MTRGLALFLLISLLSHGVPQENAALATIESSLLSRFQSSFGSSRSHHVPVFIAKQGCFLSPVFEGTRLSRVLLLPRYALPLDVEKQLMDQPNSCSLTGPEYAALVKRVSAVVPLGNYVRTIDDPQVSASRSWDVEEYEGAYIRRAYGNEEDNPQDQTFTVRAYIYVPHSVEGTVAEKRTYEIDGVVFWVVTIEERQYWVKEPDYAKLRIGQHASITGFGPQGRLLEDP